MELTLILMSKSIIIIIPYFGKFPEWSDLFFETLRCNSSIDFYFFTDCDIEKYESSNIKYQKISFEDYISFINKRIDLNFNPPNPYKLCDLRPLYGYIHHDVINKYDFYGWTDMDILFGDIRSFYTDDILSKYEVLSTHNIRISGHLSLFKNSKKNIMMFKKIYNSEIMKWYINEIPSLFINLSSSEGIPVSIMEAMSFGIPVIATDVGGTSEIVNNENGYLISENPSIEEVKSLICDYLTLTDYQKNLKKNAAYKTWENSYNAEINYTEFCNLITQL